MTREFKYHIANELINAQPSELAYIQICVCISEHYNNSSTNTKTFAEKL